MKNPDEIDRTVGYGYFQKFKKRNSYHILSKKGNVITGTHVET